MDHVMRRRLRAHQAVAAMWLVLFMAGAGCDGLFGSTDDAIGKDASLSGPAPVPPRPPVLTSEKVASVNGVPISMHDVTMRIADLQAQYFFANPEGRWEPLGTQELEAVMGELIEAELMGQNAVSIGVLRSVDTQRRWDMLRRRFLAEEWVRANEDSLVRSADIEQYYNENLLGFREPGRIKLRHLIIGSEAEARQALVRLHGEGADFESLARELSVGPTAVQGGTIRQWVMRADEKLFVYGSEAEASASDVISLDPSLEAAAFAIDRVGGISNDVNGADGRYHIFQLVERVEGGQRALTEVYDWIKQALFLEKLQQTVDGFAAEARIERFPERVWDVEQ